MTTSLLAPTVEPGAIPVRNAWYLLLYAWDLARWKGSSAQAAESSPNLLGLLAQVLCETTHALLSRQLGRAFLSRHGEIRGIRGKVDFAASIKRLSFESGRTACRYPELSIDTLRNRILRSTLDRLLRDDRMTACASAEKAKALRHDLRSAVRLMEGVTSIAVQASHFSQLQLTRNDLPYRLPLAICALLQRLEMPTQSDGDHLLSALLRDEILFSQVFERFVRNFYRYHLANCDVRSEALAWFDELASPFAPSMFTDTTIETRSLPKRRVVIDTKYYRSHLSGRYEGSAKFLSHNLYQMYAYLRTQEERGQHFRSAEGVLLYPATGAGQFDQSMQVQGHRIRIRTLDLSANWPDIEGDLHILAKDLLQQTVAHAAAPATVSL
jgi:5-methylcytosine-specific restriction enzyme subunit McrC